MRKVKRNIYYSEISSEEEEEKNLWYNPWEGSYSPPYNDEETDVSELEEESYNPATFLAEICITNIEEISKGPANVGPLDYQQQQALDLIFEEYADICAKSQTEIGQTIEITHKIPTGDALPIAQRFYRTNPDNAKFIEEEVQRMLQANIIQPSHSSWASPVVVVGKKKGDKRFCIDYRK